ncbi:type I glutamate--ammonia ligase [Candidatus Woesearchaeota archaeon]|nr:type I glutamate--ammonia ligase [Candidatus Woesearchaeota archaeon]
MINLLKSYKAEEADFKFTDVIGTWQHFSMPISALDDKILTEGIGFDGSSIKGFKSIEESDTLLIPDLSTAFIDKFCSIPTLSIICDVYDTDLTPYSRDPRGIAKRAEKYLKDSGIADVSYWGPEAEFFILDSLEFSSHPTESYFKICSDEFKTIRNKEGYFPVSPSDTQQDIRAEMVKEMKNLGIEVERHHHEVATAGQAEIDIKYNSLVKQADNMMLYKYIVKNTAKKHGKVAVFMPKPLFGDNGSGMHVHQSLWKEGKNLFHDESGYGGISKEAIWYIGGLFKHADALMAICAPTTNSYKRLVPGYEAPVNLVYSKSNRSAAVRIPMYSKDPKTKRIEFRPPDPSCNPYLAFAALLMAGLDGIENKIEPGEAVDKDIFELEGEEKSKIKSVPGSLEESLKALEEDHGFLLKGNVFNEDSIKSYINYKRKKEIDYVRMRPNPAEFYLYNDV